jgi:hypothetical protein
MLRVLLGLAAAASGSPAYVYLCRSGLSPLWLRDDPWLLELLAAVLSLLAIALTVRSFREKRLRVVSTASALLAVLMTAGFLSYVHQTARAIPPRPSGLAAGTSAEDFTLDDQTGHPWTLSSARGHPVLLVFYRGFW